MTARISLRCRTCDAYRPADARTLVCPICGSVCDHRDRGALAPVEPEPVAEPLSLWPTTPPSNGNPQSDAAADSLTEPVLSDQQRRVLNALWRALPGGLTDEEIVRVTGLNPSSARPRRGELVIYGLVEESGQTRTTASGRKAGVWRLTREAIRRAEAARPNRAEAA